MIPLRLLLIEDSENDAELVTHELSRAGYDVLHERVDTPEALVAALERQRWDLAISDYTMPRFSGTAALALLRAYDAEMPFIFVSGTIGEEAAVLAMKTGAHDYVRKGHLKRLVPAVERELREAAGRVLHKQAEARLVHLAYHDALTDLPNRVLLHDRLTQALLGAQRTHEPLALMILDLDGFKAINDSLGHHAGDHILRECAARIRGLLREVDTVARLGGDEFAVVLPRTQGDGALLAAQKILQVFNRPVTIEGHSLLVGGSLGIACYPAHGSQADALMRRADIAMYVAKTGGLGYAVYTPDRDRHVHRRLTLMTDLRDGIERGQFSLDYQPIVNLQTGQVARVEALAHWDHPIQGRLPAGEFSELAERTGLTVPLTMFLLDTALGEWSGPDCRPPVPISVNLSPRSLRDPDLPDRIADMLRIWRASPETLVIEITENMFMSDAPRSLACLSRLRDLGVTLALDNFGAGYSSLSYLNRLPIAELKIDRSLVSAFGAGDYAIVRSTIELGHQLGLTVVAEGVESAESRDRLQAVGCDAAQGQFIAESGSAAEIRRWVARQNAVGPSSSNALP